MHYEIWDAESEKRYQEMQEKYNRLSCCEKYVLEKCSALKSEIRSLKDDVISLESFLRHVTSRLNYFLENQINFDDRDDARKLCAAVEK